MKHVAYAIGGLILAFILFVNLVNAPRKRELDRKNRENADRIVRALRAYQHDHGTYPEELSRLEPDYLKPVPARLAYPGDTAGSPFHYVAAENGKSFTIGYWEAPIGMFPSDLEATYDSSTGAWKKEER